MSDRADSGRSRSEKFLEKTLTDVQRRIYVQNWEISNEELGLNKKWRIEKRRLQGGLSDGIEIVELNNGSLSFTVVPTRGMSIWKGQFEGACLGWESPVKSLVHPHYINLEARGGLGWLDGFNEWVVRCGLENFGESGLDVIVDNMGNKREVMLTLHGKIANIPASSLKAVIGLEPPFELGVKGVVYERCMFGSNLKMSTSITTTPKSNSIKIVDEIENIRSVPDEMQLLYHCNYGAPFLEEGARFAAPVKEVAPRNSRSAEGIDRFDVFDSPKAGFVEQVYFFKLMGDDDGRTLVMLMNRDGTKAVSISFSLNELPYFTLWKNTGSSEDGYVVGLEPGTSFPNARSFERTQNRVVKLQPREKYESEITLSAHLGKNNVEKMRERINELGGGIEPKVFTKPVKGFSPQ